jgi:hypothetical protein
MRTQALKSKHGSKFGFHGSSIENWQSIFRKGQYEMGAEQKSVL